MLRPPSPKPPHVGRALRPTTSCPSTITAPSPNRPSPPLVPPPASRHASPPSPAPGRSPQRGSGFTPDNILPLRNYRSLPKPPKSDRLLVPPPASRHASPPSPASGQVPLHVGRALRPTTSFPSTITDPYPNPKPPKSERLLVPPPPVAMLRPRPLPPGRSPQRGSGFTPDNILPLRNYRSLPNRQTAQPSPNPPLIPPRAPPFFHRASASVHSPRSTFPRPPTKVLHPNLVNFHPVLSGMTIVSLSSHSKL